MEKEEKREMGKVTKGRTRKRFVTKRGKGRSRGRRGEGHNEEEKEN